MEFILAEELQVFVKASDIEYFLKNAINTIAIVNTLEKQTGSKMSHFLKLIPFMSKVGAHFNPQPSASEIECAQHKSRLDSIVESCGFTIQTIAADGNCCFGAIAYSLFEQKNSIEVDFPSYLSSKSLSQTINFNKDYSSKACLAKKGE